MNLLKEENNLPVHYCSSCLSLAIKNLKLNEDESISYCNNCSGTETLVTTIFEWEKLYKNKYNKSYLEYGKS